VAVVMTSENHVCLWSEYFRQYTTAFVGLASLQLLEESLARSERTATATTTLKLQRDSFLEYYHDRKEAS
jgi:hypothetical protein